MSQFFADYISRLKGDGERWVLRRATRFSEISAETCVEVTTYRRNFAALLSGELAIERTLDGSQGTVFAPE